MSVHNSGNCHISAMAMVVVDDDCFGEVMGTKKYFKILFIKF